MIGFSSERLESPPAPIDPAVIADIPAILEISEEGGLSPWTGSDYLNELNRTDSIILVARSDVREAIGFIAGRFILGNGPGQRGEAEIYNISVRISYRKLGIGTSLLGRFLEVCIKNRVEHVFLDVRPSNDTALRFYREHDFEQIAVRKHFYRHPMEDAIILRLTLHIS